MAAPPPAPTPPALKGYVGFGSFMSDNVEELVRASPWSSPPPPAPVAAARAAARPLAGYGAAARPAFRLDLARWTFLNHGAFGSAAAVAVAEARAWADAADAQPLAFIDRALLPRLVDAGRAVAAALRAAPEDVALVPNATYALTSVVLSLGREAGPGDALVCLDVGYGSVTKMLRAAAEGGRGGARVAVVPTPPPGRDAAAWAAAVAARVPADAALVVLDHVTSNSALVLPLAALIPAVRAAAPRAAVLVDGAHGLGALDLDVPALGADFYVSNAHKWLCAPRGCGVLWAAPRSPARARLRPAAISHGYGAGFSSDFIWDGARDYGAALCLPGLLRWWDAAPGGGLPGARAYCRGALQEGVAILCGAWGTQPHAPPDVWYSHMACVQLPASALPPGAVDAAAEPAGRESGASGGDAEAAPPAAAAPRAGAFRVTSAHSKAVQDALHACFRVEAPVKTLVSAFRDSRAYVRVSAGVYTTPDDFRRLAAVVLELRWADDGTPLAPPMVDE